MKTKISFYFVLYLIVLVELLAVIIERDTSEQQTKSRLSQYETVTDSLIKMYQLPILISVQKETNWTITNKDSLGILISVSELQTPREKEKVKFHLKLKDSNLPWSSNHVVLDSRTGNGSFYFTEKKPGEYTYNVYCTVHRAIPKYLPNIVYNQIAKKLGENFEVSSDTVHFLIKASYPMIIYHKPGRY